MVSPALSEWLERARVRFGLEVEVLDAGLRSLYPDSTSELAQIIEDSPAVRRTLLDALAGGRAERLESDGAHYRFYPLRQASKRKQATGLLAIRRRNGDVDDAPDAEPWSELARAIVETDLDSSEMLAGERSRSRQLAGTFRFIEFVTETPDEPSLSHALIHAAAIWYDVDARIYRRDLAGDFVLDSWLPGVTPDAASTRLTTHVLNGSTDSPRAVSAGIFGDAAIAQDVLIVPLAQSSRPDWILVLIGNVPADAESMLRLVGRIGGGQFARFAERRSSEARNLFDAALADTARAPELIAVRVVHGVAQGIQAGGAVLSLTRKGLTRRIASVGTVAGDGLSVPAEDVTTGDRITHVMALGGDDIAVLDLQAAPGRMFSIDDGIVAKASATALRTWLAGTLTSLDATAAILDVAAVAAPAFAARIQEELERARRFDLRLSLILVDVPARSDAMGQLHDALKRELRGSDVTGAMSGTQVAALLTHTDELGLDNVVRRVRQRLADAAERLNVSDLKLGQAAFSPEVRTADALLELALRQAQPIIVH